MKHTPLLTLLSASLPFAAVLAGTPPEIATQPQDQKVVVGQTATPSVLLANPTLWIERLRNPDGSMNWTEYANVATHAGELAQRDYLLGPKYAYYHPTAESFPTLALQGDADGWEGPADKDKKLPGALKLPHYASLDWYAQAGPLLYVADDPQNAGVIQAANGEMFIYDKSLSFGFWCRLHWGTKADGWYTHTTPPQFRQGDWNSPKKPTAVASPTGIPAVPQYVAFQNGLIGTFPVVGGYRTRVNGKWTDGRYPFVQLPAGKTPLALAVTPVGEFVLAAIWDSIQRKGQVAVIAVQGQVLCSQDSDKWEDTQFTGTYLYGFPCWHTTKSMKLLGFVDLPIAAPTAIAVGHNLQWTGSGRCDKTVNAKIGSLLDSQGERDLWHKGSPPVYPNYKRTASAGYAVVTSRSENKVVFVDLQPLLAYYRDMYFTTQARYDETKNVGAEANQWPYTFDHSPKQKPVVACTLDIPAPTAAAAGLSAGMAGGRGCPHSCGNQQWRVSSFADQYAYVTTMDGRLLMYAVGGLNAEAAAAQPVLVKEIRIGKNPTSIEHGNGGVYKNDIVINCRGDKSVYALTPGGDQLYVLRDSRIVDPVMAESSYNGRSYIDRYFIHVVDFTGKIVLTYVHKKDFLEPMKFGASTDVPGHPFAYQQDEVP